MEHIQEREGTRHGDKFTFHTKKESDKRSSQPASTASESTPESTSQAQKILRVVVFPGLVFGFAFLYTNVAFSSTSSPEELASFGESATHLLMAGIFVLISILAEQLVPHKNEWNRFSRQEIHDWGHYVLAIAPGESLAKVLMYALIPWLVSYVPLIHNIWPSQWPMVVQAVLSILAHEFAYYWFHRFCHIFHWMWSLHRLHHSSEFLTVTKGFRHNLIEFMIDGIFTLAIVLTLQIPPVPLIWTYGIIIPVQVLSHANLEVTCPTCLEWILVLPSNHRIHHAIEDVGWQTNYGAYTLFWDVVFGTYMSNSKFEPSALGLDNNTLPIDFWGQYWSFLHWKTLDSSPDKLAGGSLYVADRKHKKAE